MCCLQVGSGQHELEVPQAVVDRLYKNINEEGEVKTNEDKTTNKTNEYHNKDFVAMRWPDFFSIKSAYTPNL